MKEIGCGQFMNYSDGIWTVNSSTSHSVWCRVDRTDNITDNMIYFNRSFINGNGTWVDEKYQGNVSSTDNTTMLVGLQGADPTTEEKLYFATSNYSCGVFQVTLFSVFQGLFITFAAVVDAIFTMSLPTSATSLSNQNNRRIMLLLM
ncbi:uncharacterized protein LOC119374705 [Rhipicephalus sanguineus]|uniref:uncharacterized protein LOC119374705 n=1 Tax=Rhipicephalus sanguineus TaxID=34632 RepID=UPI0020C27783|nr:uncharacterized protein LOC119374705 [Rhipicephalus sanguineus]